MNKFLSSLLVTLFFVGTAAAQSIEYSVHLNSGVFSFSGKSAVENTMINFVENNSYTNNPYGENEALSYGLAIQAQRITKNNFILGIQAGFEVLRSNVNVTHVSGLNEANTPVSASGSTILRHNFLHAYPHIGYRINMPTVKVDLAFGTEHGFSLSSREKGEAVTEDGVTVTTDRERSDPGRDFRIRPSLVIHYDNWGLSTGYSLGISNYKDGFIGGVNAAYSRYFRFGITYKL